MAKKLETKFKEKVRPLLNALPRSWILKTNEVAIRGIPDFLMCVNGHFIAIELKIDGEAADALQEWNIDKIIRSGGLGFTVTPSTFEHVYNTLIQIALGKISARPETLPENVLSS